MIYENFVKSVNLIAWYTPNKLIPVFGEKITKGKISQDIWAEFYLTGRFIFALVLAIFIAPCLTWAAVIAIIQIPSLVYLLKIVFPLHGRNLKDPGRSLFFAFGHYLEIGFSMAY